MDPDIIKASKPILGDTADLLELIRTIEIAKGNIFLQPPPFNVCEGDYFIGSVYYGETRLHPFFLKEKQLPEHLGIFGRTGAAKTNLIFWLLESLAKNNKNFWIFDFKKEYRDLLQKPLFKDVIVYTVGRDDISPIRLDLLSNPAGTSPDSYLNHLKNIIGEAYNCLDGAQDVIRDSLHAVYHESGMFSNKIKQPTFKSVYADLSLRKFLRFSREALWHDSACRALRSINYGGFGNAINPDENSISPSDLINKTVIWELDALDLNSKIFFIEALLNWLYHYRLNNKSESILELVIIIDEAQNLISKDRLKMLSTVTKGHETIIEKFIREIRVMGIGLVLAGHNVSLFPIQVTGNLGTIFDLNTKHSDDVLEASKSLLLKEKEFLGALQPGYAIVKLSQGWLKPFLIKTEIYNIEKGRMRGNYGDLIIRSRMRGYSTGFNQNEAFSSNQGDFQLVHFDSINKDELAFLISIAKGPFLSTRERYKALGFNPRTGNEIQTRFIKNGCIETLVLRTGKNAFTKFYALTNQGRLLVKESGVSISCPEKESFEHEYWKCTIAEKLRKIGWSVYLEWNNIDLMVEKDGRRIAIEIKTRPDGWQENLENIKKHLIEEIYFLSSCKNSISFLKERLSANVKVLHPWHFNP